MDDWPSVKKRWEAWWQSELYDRVLVAVTAPRQGVVPGQDLEVDPETQWTDVDYMIGRNLQRVRSTHYGGEALPVFAHNWACGHALPFGCEPHFERDTVWVDPAPVADDGYPTLDGWWGSSWWRWMLDSTEGIARASQGRYFVWPGWGNHGADALALVRGTENLLVDIALNPEWVKGAVQEVARTEMRAVDMLWPLVSPDATGVEGYVDATSCWSPTKSLCIACDVSCLVSTEDFNQLFLPPLIEMMHTVDHTTYHLDGPGAIRHFDALLSLPELHAVQWVPGAGHEDVMQWIPLIQRIQRGGKCVEVRASPLQIEPLLKEVRPEGLLIRTFCPSEEDAGRLLDRVASLY